MRHSRRRSLSGLVTGAMSGASAFVKQVQIRPFNLAIIEKLDFFRMRPNALSKGQSTFAQKIAHFPIVKCFFLVLCGKRKEKEHTAIVFLASETAFLFYISVCQLILCEYLYA